MTFRIFIYCDDPSHAPRRVAVTNFVHVEAGMLGSASWHEEPSSRASRGKLGAGMHMVGDLPAADGWANDPDVANEEIRDRFELVCRKCRTRPVPARAGNLFAVLDRWQALGVAELSLAVIAANLREQAERGSLGGP